MTEQPEAVPPSAASLEDLVYRASLAEGNRAVRGASPWLTVPVSLAVAGALAAGAYGLARKARTGPPAPKAVELLLLDGPEGPPGGPGPRPGPPAAAPAPRMPPAARAPGPEPQPQALPVPERVQESVPEAAPREDPAGRPGAGGTGPGSGGAGPGIGSGGGGGGGGLGGHGAGVALPDITQLARPRFQPPDPEYPALARSSRIQGTVVLEVTLGADGVPLQAHALSGPYALRACAEAWAMAWRFFPYLQNGLPQAGLLKLTVTFRLK
jgi:TonB family protein